MSTIVTPPTSRITEEDVYAEPGMTRRRQVWVWAKDKRYYFVVAIVALCLGAYGYYLFGPSVRHGIQTSSSPAAAVPATTNIPTSPSAGIASAQTDEAKAKEFDRELIHGGEGFDNPVARQLEEKADVFAKIFKFNGDITSSHDRKAWAQHYAHVIAIRTGHADWKFGGEIRYWHPNTVRIVITLSLDGRGITVGEYTVAGGTTPTRVTSTDKPIDFLGAHGTTSLLPYEYRYPQ